MNSKVIAAAALLAMAACSNAMAQRDGQQVLAEEARHFLGRTATVCGTVESARFAENAEGEPTFLHLGAAFPRHPFQVRINGSDRDNFDFKPEEALIGKLICATGRISGQRNRAEMQVTSPSELALGVMQG
jgi:hypothetical protein